MKVKKILLIMLVILLSTLMILPTSVSAATKELGIVSLREGGYGYQINGKNIWKIVERQNTGYTYDNAYYCLKGGAGFGSNSKIEDRTYNIPYDLKKISVIPDSIKSVLPSDVAKTFNFGGDIFNYTDYNAVLWLLDNMYLPKNEDAATMKANLWSRVFPQLDTEQIKLTDDDIEVVQQVALWYFTNSDSSNTAEYEYHFEELPAIQLTTQEGGLGPFDLTLDDLDDTFQRQDQAYALYQYLIVMARIYASNYGTGEVRTTTVIPAELVETNPTATITNGTCVIGPYAVNQADEAGAYELIAKVTDQAGNELQYKILDGAKQELAEGITLKDLVNQNFYISIADNSEEITSVNFELTIKYFDTETTFWTVGGSELIEQPVVEVSKIERIIPGTISTTIERKEFDLSLRKFIVGINDRDINNRYPTIDYSGLENGTTAIYEHTKAPLSVTTGDIVKYKIRVYNEGELDGYAQKVSDYIPEGLGFIIGHDVNSENNWIIESNQDINTVKLTSIQNATNNLTLDDFVGVTSLGEVEVVTGKAKISTTKLKYDSLDSTHENLIASYDSEQTNLSFKDLEIVCIVLEDSASDIDLKNIAEITECVDEHGNLVQDRDSIPNDVIVDQYPDNTNVQDDDDFEKLTVQEFDLSLRKFITKVGDKEITDRVPIPSLNTSTGEITYQHPKDVVQVRNGDLVTYTIRVYNEGAVSGYASIIKDTLPDELEFVEDNETNIQYGWTVGASGKTITTTYLAKNDTTDTLLQAFDSSTMNSPDWQEVEVVCKVNVPDGSNKILTNTAEIQNDTNNTGEEVIDKDSTPGNGAENEDDIDTEKVQIVIFDLSLNKFITAVNDEQITDREPIVTQDDLGNINYTYVKDPVIVKNQDVVIYTIRVYNEGNISGYAEEIKDDVPQGLIFLPDHSINVEYRWELNSDGTIRTDYLSKAQDEANLLQAYDKQTVHYKDVKVAFQVNAGDLPLDRIIINTAEISDDYNEIDVPDEDSVPDNDNTVEDDIDKEYLEVQYFDLALLKYITKVTVDEDGEIKVTETGHTGLEDPEPMVKVDLDKKKMDKTTVDFTFTIKVTNEGEIEGYAKEIIDYIPEGLEFVAEDNPEWMIKSDGSIVTRQLENTLLQPGESATVEIVLRWINGEDNLQVKTNVAEINEDGNDSNTPDIDSIPGNKVDSEDDIDDASVILSIKTGSAPTYVSIVAISLAILGTGIVTIRKYIM